ncbi:MAG: hypothetical protein JXN65_10945 [Clostridia bacterium]|nr:hypothetical protein [Clostridia bacterium]
MNISSKFSLWVLSLVAVVAVSIAATLLYAGIRQHDIELTEKAKEEQKTVYGADGKTNGEALSDTPIRITDEYIYYDDRVVMRYAYAEADVIVAANAINAAAEWMPDDINMYLSVIPGRIAFDYIPSIEDADALQQATEEIHSSIDTKIDVIDAQSVLESKKTEYIYFRTDETWTALGAYFLAEEFLQHKGTQIIPLADYDEWIFEGYSGTYRFLAGADKALTLPDTVSYYILKGSSNSQEITSYDDSEYRTYNSPVIALSRRATDIFIGEFFSHTIIEGDGESESSVMVMGGKQAKFLAPWLIPYYDKVCLVDPAFFYSDGDALLEMMKTYNVTDFLIIESIMSPYYMVENQKMIEIFAQSTLNTEE